MAGTTPKGTGGMFAASSNAAFKKQLNSKFEIAILSSTKKGVKLLRDNLLFKFNDFQNQMLNHLYNCGRA